MNRTWQRRAVAIGLTLAAACGGSSPVASVPNTSEDADTAPETVVAEVPDVAAPADAPGADDAAGDVATLDTSDVALFDEDAGPTDAVDADEPPADVTNNDVAPDDALASDTGDAATTDDAGLDDAVLDDTVVDDVEPIEDATPTDGVLLDDVLLDDVLLDDALATDVGAPLPPLVPGACEAAVPRRLFDRVVLAGPTGLLGAPFGGVNLESFGPSFGAPPNPPTARPGALGSAELFVSSVEAGVCRVRALTGQGVELASASLPAAECASPLVLDGELVQALTDGQDGRLVWLSADTLAPKSTVELPGPVTSAPVRVGGRIAVGAGSVVVVADASGVQASVETGLPRVRRVLVPSPGLLIAFGGEGADDFGDAFVRLAYDGSTLDAADPVTLPGPALAEPIALAGCDGSIANGGSHWWCPGGLIVAAGSGWLSAYDATTGLVRGEGAVTMDVTGLAATDDGFVYNGGSHWLGGWDFGVADFYVPGAPTVKSLLAASAAEPQCVSSPLPQEDGTIVFVAADALHRVATGSGELGPGWTRAGGDLEGTGTPRGAADSCPGTDVRLYARQLRRQAGLDLFRDAVLAPTGDVYVAGGMTAFFGGAASAPRLWRLGADGEQRWVATLLNGPGEERPALAVAPVGGRLAVVATRVEANGDPTPALNVVSLDGSIVFDQTLPPMDTGSGVFPRAVFVMVGADATTAVLVGNVYSLSPQSLWASRIAVDGDAPAAPMYDVNTALTSPVAFSTAQRVGPSIWVLGREDAVAGEASAIILSLAPATGQLEWTQRHSGAPGIYARALAVVETASGASIAEERLTIATSTYSGAIVRVDLGGNVLEEVPLSFIPIGIALMEGREVVAEQSGKIGVLDGSALDMFPAFSLGTSTVLAGRVFVHERTPLVVGSATNATGFDLIDLSVARLDAYANASCSASGRCATSDCDDHEPCTIDGCDRTTGGCTNAPRPDGVECGIGRVCAAGSCQ